MKKRTSIFVKILRVIGIVLGAILILAVGLIGYLSATEYKPAETESITANGTSGKALSVGDMVTVMGWNIGYGALGETADFFMDGGSMVRAQNREIVLTDMCAITEQIRSVNPDILMLQEIDRDSSRSHRVNEYGMLCDNLPAYQSAFANNYKVSYIPYPMPPLGKVDSGIATFAQYDMHENTRIQLPVPFSWPMRIINLKRCLLVSHIAVDGSDKELVVINLHLEAYDEGEGKRAQTQMLADLLKAEAQKGNYVIAGGDFNQVFSDTDTAAVPLYDGNWEAPVIDVSALGDGWTCLMDASTPSCRLLNRPYQGADKDTFQYYIIDGFIVSNNLTVESFETRDLGFVHSDHNPLVLTLKLS